MSGLGEKKEKKGAGEQTAGDVLWVWNSFEIITPYAWGRLIRLADVDESITDRENLSVPASSLYGVIYDISYGDNIMGDTMPLSDATLRNIVMEFMEDDLRDEGYETEEAINQHLTPDKLEEYTIDRVRNELGKAEPHPKHHPVLRLCRGILYDNNWRWLSDEDKNKWCAGYGAFTSDGTADIKMVIGSQNGMLRELLSRGYSHEIRGIETLSELIQPEYDPDYKAPQFMSPFVFPQQLASPRASLDFAPSTPVTLQPSFMPSVSSQSSTLVPFQPSFPALV